MEILIEPTPLKMISWNASDNGNNDDYDSYYAYDCIYSIDNGASSSITEEEVIERFIERSMKVLSYLEECNLEKLDWKLVKKNEGEYVIKYWEVEYQEELDASILTSLNFTTENVFQLI
jgi:hypothetical protein